MSHSSLRPVPGAALLAVLALLAAGCSAEVSTSKTVNTGEAEKQIAKSLKDQQGITATVTCPDDVKAKKGATFDCKVKADSGETGTAHVTQKDDEGNIRWTVR